METKKEIQEFLTSRRAAVTPEQAGLPTYGARRVPGLRREEVAVLAGVSVPYYTRLERGDLSGVSEGRIYSRLVADWKRLVDELKVTKDARYLHHGGKPVLFVWGFFPTPPGGSGGGSGWPGAKWGKRFEWIIRSRTERLAG